jgi:diguanylate cyclase (GGDEF)-like protein
MAKIPMLTLGVLVIHIALGLLCLATARGENRMVSVRYWGWGLLAYPLGIIVTTLAPLLTRGAASFLGNSIIAYAPIPFIQGVLSNTRCRLDFRWVGGFWAVTVAILAYNNFSGAPIKLVNLVTPSPIAILLFFYGGGVLLRRPVEAAVNASRFLACVLIACSVIWILRIATLSGVLGLGSDVDRVQWAVDVFSILQILVSVIGMLCLYWIEVLKGEATLKTMAFGDALTGLPNRRATMMRFEDQSSLALRLKMPFTMMVFDIDFFKRVNDTHGHQAGDLVLKHVAATLTAAKRREDLLGRVGGEEFVLLLVNTGMEGALVIAERMREMIANSFLPFEGKRIAVTISGGLAQFPQDGESWDQLFAVADQRLYQSKTEGRNRITVAG